MEQPNPYNYNLPVEPTMFFGRTADVDALAHRLTATPGDSVALIGGRRMGKTSMLEALARALTDQDYDLLVAPVFIDLSGESLGSPNAFFRAVTDYVRAGSIAPLTDDAGAGIIDEQPPAPQFRRLLETWSRACLASQGRRLRLVVLMDECEEIVDRPWAGDLHAALRTLLVGPTTRSLLKVVMAGSHRFLTQVRQHGSPLWNVLTYHLLRVLDEQATRKLIRQPTRGILSEDVEQIVLEQSGGHPCLTQYVMAGLWEAGLPPLTEAAHERAACFARERHDFQDWIGNLGHAGAAVYRTLAASPHTMSDQEIRAQLPDDPIAVSQALTALVYHGLVDYEEGRQRYRVSGSMFKDWFLDHYVVQSRHKEVPQVEEPGFTAQTQIIVQGDYIAGVQPVTAPGALAGAVQDNGLGAARLELMIMQAERSQYRVQLRFQHPRGGGDNDLLSAPVGLVIDEVRLTALALDASAYGAYLSACLFQEAQLLNAFQQVEAVAQALNVPLRMRLTIEPTAIPLHALRWETLLHPTKATPLVMGERVLFSRYPRSEDWAPVQLESSANLRALALIANPSNLPLYQLAEIDVASELSALEYGLRGIPLTTLSSPGTATFANLDRALRDKHQIIHVVCHGAHIEGETWLYLENEQGMAAPVRGAELLTRFREARHRPALVVLAACASADVSRANPGQKAGIAALAPQFAAAGVPAVIGMQSHITMHTARSFFSVLYETLRGDSQIDRAVALARGAVRDEPDWWAPVLFLRLTDGAIWS